MAIKTKEEKKKNTVRDLRLALQRLERQGKGGLEVELEGCDCTGTWTGRTYNFGADGILLCR